MNKYINTRQLAFLIFILIAIFLIRYFRSNRSQPAQQPEQIESSLQQAFRKNPIDLSDLAACQMQCMTVSDSSLQLILRYGNITGKGDTQTIEGLDMEGRKIQFQFTATSGKTRVLKLDNVPDRCQCSE